MRKQRATVCAALAITLAVPAGCGGDDEPTPAVQSAKRPAEQAPPAERRQPEPAKDRVPKRKRAKRPPTIVMSAPKVGATTTPEPPTGFPDGPSVEGPQAFKNLMRCLRGAGNSEAGQMRCYEALAAATGGKGIRDPGEVPEPLK